VIATAGERARPGLRGFKGGCASIRERRHLARAG
jgi:hypothetical protein